MLSSLVALLFLLSIGVSGCPKTDLRTASESTKAPSPARSTDLLGAFLVDLTDVNAETVRPSQNSDCLSDTSGCEYVDIGGDRRRAVRLGAGSNRVATTAVHGDSWLRFSFSSYGEGTKFSVTIRAAEVETMIRPFIVPRAREWFNAEIPLRDFSGKDCTVSVSVDHDGDLAFAIPRIISSIQSDVADDRLNVLFYLVDTLRADHVSTYGYERITTPFLDDLGKRSLVYLNSYSTSAWTRPSTASLLTGLYPSFHQANARMRLPLEVSTIAEILRSEGWSTWAFVANGNVNASGLDFEQGFDRFVAIKPQGRQPDADQINDLVLPWLDEVGDEPFFLYIHSVDPHAPYNPPKSVRFRFTDPDYQGPVVPKKTKKKILAMMDPTEADLVHIRGLYDEEILFQDAMIRELHSALESSRLVERTYGIITSDHGEEFFEHGYWEHGKRLFEEQIRVPLIVIPPTTVNVSPGRITSPVQGVDLVPSILSWVGVPFEKDDFQGSPLPTANRTAASTRSVYCEEIRHDSGFDLFSFTDGDRKVITKKNRESGGRKIWLFNLRDDPHELENLFSQDSGITLELVKRLESYPSTALSGKPVQSIPEPSLDQDALDQLRALGYIE
jgi:arylsulfatase A-like enzyme